MKLTGVEHDLKIWPAYFGPVATDLKPWELRLNDRNYGVGDVLNLREWDPHRSYYTGRGCRRVVTYILHAGFGLPDGYVVMSVARLTPPKTSTALGWMRFVVVVVAVAAMVWMRALLYLLGGR